MFRLHTPGGGGYGREEDTHRRPHSKRRRLNETFPERGSVYEYRMAQEGAKCPSTQRESACFYPQAQMADVKVKLERVVKENER